MNKHNIISLYSYDSPKLVGWPKAVELIKHYEGFKAEAYRDMGGLPTVGYGFTYLYGRPVQMGDVINKNRAEQVLSDLVEAFSSHVIAAVTGYNLERNQIGALISFSYNVGIEAFKNSTLLKVIKHDKANYDEIKQQFLKWKYVKGKVVDGLINRRKSEYHLYAFDKVKFYN